MAIDILQDRIVVTGTEFAAISLGVPSVKCRGFRCVGATGGFLLSDPASRTLLEGDTDAIDEEYASFRIPDQSIIILTAGALTLYTGKEEDEDDGE